MVATVYSRTNILGLIAGLAFLAALTPATAQSSGTEQNAMSGRIVGFHDPAEPGIGGFELQPQSSIESPADIGVRAHTHLRILVPPNGVVAPVSHDDAMFNNSRHEERRGFEPDASSSSSVFENTPSSVACLYNLMPQPSSQPAGCNPRYTTVNPSGGGGAIAVVDAYDDPTAWSDLVYFSLYFGMSPGQFSIIYAGTTWPYTNGPRPPSGVPSGWNVEEALDVQWAHAMAPRAHLFLIEAQDDSTTGLLYAIAAAEYAVYESGGGEVSMSWGGSEFSGETNFDYYFSPSFAPPNVAFVAAAGDSDNLVSYPASSPYVVGVGGTTVNRNSSGSFVSETAWNDTGGGISALEARPSFQNSSAVERFSSTHRSTPDVAFDSNPNTGLAIYVSGQWGMVGGTSVATPSVAGIINVADSAAGIFPSASTELAKLYANYGNTADFRDVTSGACGRDSAVAGYDLCTGMGSLFSYSGK